MSSRPIQGVSDEQNQAKQLCSTKNSLNPVDDNQFHVIKLDDIDRNRRISHSANKNIIQERPPHGQSGTPVYNNKGCTTEMQREITLSNGSVMKFKWIGKCPVCRRNSKYYYCADCVRNGNFYHSSLKLPERFAEKRLRERRLQQYIASLEENAPAEVARLYKKENMKQEIEDARQRIELIKKVVESERERIKKANAEEELVKAQIHQLQKTNPMFQTKNGQIRQNISLYCQRIPEKIENVSDLEKIIKMKVRKEFHELNAFIFPVAKISTETSREDCLDSLNEETVKELADASQTHYVNGKWINTTHFAQEINYSILSMSLPGSGDYASFIRPQTGTKICEKKETQNICAGLTYLCQMVNLLAYYLGIHLPKKIAFSDFSDFNRQDMGKRKFQTLVSRLNQNVIYLCVSQGVQPHLLHPLRALHNIVALLTEGQAEPGRCGSFEFPDCIIDRLEVAGCYEDVADSDSDDDWETVGHMPLPEFSSSPPAGPYCRPSSLDETASGIVTSAAASVMSMFRGIGNPMK